MGYIEELRKIIGNRPLILVGCVVLIFDKDNRLLLQRRPEGNWGLPGGLMELGESTEETARREVREETGLTLGELSLAGIFSGKEYFVELPNGDQFYAVTVAYAAKEYSGRPAPHEETIELGFFRPDQLPEATNPRIRKMIEHILHHHE